ncbi:hypothetical protein [Isorropodon fossajaponicum symbiont]|uniref:hypothetical protein n=1 Tax=Isorropodon fossajaponicum symbiont TaxID=883811 RepID=UPI00191584A1|nr:hypothetical protein [Isorropodon fossajaponicum symbiont]
MLLLQFKGMVAIRIVLGGAAINYHNANFDASIGKIGTPFGSYGTGMIKAIEMGLHYPKH